jgi:hypothetical protein
MTKHKILKFLASSHERYGTKCRQISGVTKTSLTYTFTIVYFTTLVFLTSSSSLFPFSVNLFELSHNFVSLQRTAAYSILSKW